MIIFKLNEFAGKLSERHNKEIHFYENFGSRINHVHLPKIYIANTSTPKNLESGCILMEDLNGLMPNFFEGLNKIQVKFFL